MSHYDNAALDEIVENQDLRHRRNGPAKSEPETATSEIKSFDAAELAGREIPERQWVVRDWFPTSVVNQLAGDGEVGKSILGLQLAACRALKRQWLGLETAAGRTLILSAEDDLDEMHRRLDCIRRHYECSWAELAGVRCLDMTEAETILAGPNKHNVLTPTKLLSLIENATKEHHASLVILDSQTDYFAGNENDRGHARQFVNILRRRLCHKSASVILLSHLSLAGMASGSGGSGSTHWRNSMRARALFERVKATDGTEPDADLRRLRCVKANYSSRSELMLRYKDGVFVREGGIASLDKMALEHKADETFLSLLNTLNAQRLHVSPNYSKSYAPLRFASHPNSQGISQKAFEASMHRLLASGSIEISESGPPSKLRQHIILAGEK